MVLGAPAIIVDATKEHTGGPGPLESNLGVTSTIYTDHEIHLYPPAHISALADPFAGNL